MRQQERERERQREKENREIELIEMYVCRGNTIEEEDVYIYIYFERGE